MKTLRILLAAILLALPARAQIPETAKYSIPAPPLGVQGYSQWGVSVAMNEHYIVVGSTEADTTIKDVGAVKVFDTVTGVLVQVLNNPVPAAGSLYGGAVAVSGTTVVVGANQADVGGIRAGCVYVYDLAGPAPEVPTLTINNPNPSTLNRGLFGWTVAISGTRMVVGAIGDNAYGKDAGRAYVYDLSSATPTQPVVMLNDPAPSPNSYFGISVAIDGPRVVIGARKDYPGATDAGSAHVYDLTSATPETAVFNLINPSPAAKDNFGEFVGISGTRIVVGAPGDDTAGTDSGSAYVFDIAGVTPEVSTLTLTNPSPNAGDKFGESVAIHGTQVVVAASSDDTSGNNSGIVYAYDLGSGTPSSPTVTIANPHPTTNGDAFGRAVATYGTRVAVGASENGSVVLNAGAVYSYDLAGATPNVPVATLNTTSPSSMDYFGSAIAISGNLMVVGAPATFQDAMTVGSPGYACIYDLGSETPTIPIFTLNNPNQTGPNGQFGVSVAIDGMRVVVGAVQEDTGATNAGSAYVYDLSGPSPTVPQFTLHNPTPTTNDFYGTRVAVSGARVVVGAPGDDTGAIDTGSTYVYDLAGASPTSPVFTLNNPTPQAPGASGLGDAFGSALAIEGTRVVVGAKGEGVAGKRAGSAFIYDLAGANPATPVLSLLHPTPRSNGSFGWSLAISGGRLIVGAWGAAYAFDLNTATPAIPIFSWDRSTPGIDAFFGYAVGISGNRVLISAPQDDAYGTDAGVVYLYNLASPQPLVHTATLRKTSPVQGDQFGYAVGIDAKTVVVGAPHDDTTIYEKGAAYVHAPTATPNDQNADGLLDSWELAYFGTTDEQDLLADGEHDNLGNLLEEAFGTDPLLHDFPTIPPVVNEGGYLTITIAKHPGVTYLVQSSSSVVPDSFTDASTMVLIDNSTTLKVRDNIPFGTPPGRFLRVKVTAAP